MSKQKVEYPTYAEIYQADVTKNMDQIKTWFMTLPLFTNETEADKWVYISARYYLGEDNWYDYMEDEATCLY